MNTPVTKRQRAVVDFAWWAECNLPAIRANVHYLKEADARGIRNPVLRFVVPRSMNHALEHGVLRVFEAWLLVDAEMKHLGIGELHRDEPDFVRLKRVRDKLVAHRVENEVYAEEHQRWYKEELGSFDKSFTLLVSVARALSGRIREMQRSGLLSVPNQPLKEEVEFSSADVARLIQVLKDAEIF